MFGRVLLARPGLRLVGAAGASAAAGTLAYASCDGGGGRSPLVFFSDLDNTLVAHGRGDDGGLKAWCAYWEAEERSKHSSVLCYNTGRCIADYEKLLAHLLPTPDVLITGDGLEVRWCVDRERGTLELDEEWERRMREHWDRSGLRARVIARMEPHDEGLIEDLNAVSNCPPLGEARWGITVRGASRARALASELEREFDGAVYSYAMKGWDAEGVSHIVCALPSVSGKANAARYVQQKLRVPDAACVAAGDSENDATMLKTPFAFVAVANSSPGLVKALDAVTEAPGQQFRATQKCAAGATEGLKWFRSRL